MAFPQSLSPVLLIGLALISLGLVIALVPALRRWRRTHAAPAFERCAGVLQAQEAALLALIREAVGDRAIALAKVRAADVLDVRAAPGKGGSVAARDQLGQRHFDFVLCEPQSFRPLLAVALTHGRERPREADRYLHTACESARLPLLQLDAGGGYSIEALRDEFEPWLQRTAEPAEAVRHDGRREPTLDLPDD